MPEMLAVAAAGGTVLPAGLRNRTAAGQSISPPAAIPPFASGVAASGAGL